ncbi:MAG: heparan-alpha-glucosaminide N-acetyltransferase domain-containing protein [Chitinophagaceae bacterium]
MENTIPTQKTYRIESIDLLRGLIMIIMALDHVRDYFHADSLLYDPTDLTQTNIILFFTRWITHYCAPIFMLLSGTSAYLVGIRKGKKALAKFLWTRGLWLIFLEFTIIAFGWYFNFVPALNFIVIWALGVSMIVLAALIYLPFSAILFISLAMIFGHNLLDSVQVPGPGIKSILWSLVHQPNFTDYKGVFLFIGYPVIPWIGVMSLGYCLGRLYEKEIDAAKRKKTLLWMGVGAIILFIIIRYSNAYGDGLLWSKQGSAAFTVLSFINVTKYPPSLLYVLMTIGPALVFLTFTENARSGISEKIKIIGRVPLFYYIIHLYLLHLFALFATYFCGHTPGDMILNNWVGFDPKLQGYGFSLGITYAVWAVLIIILYFICKWYDKYKRTHGWWWLSYL